MEEIVLRAKDGDNEAIKAIIEKYKGLIIKEAFKYRIPSYEFEDIVQHGYLTVIKSIKMYKGKSNAFNGYIITAIKNNIAYLLRGNIKHYREVPDEAIAKKDSTENTLTIEDQIIAYEEVKKLYAALDKLNKEDREIIDKFYFDEVKIKKYCRDNNLCYSTLIKRKRKALKKLEDILQNDSN
ncbi:sigma-70 family RNA polymerase sigma factor [Oceanirhabdus seepicola]|uniref:Sigma-70 family RNA polymerase sigma factor n=1 Tax=Oceanirhabdus seepicola TaxID=2828781 RepID=A0A9J6P3P3_9CLOT|nr:sigma-70 family RNA polymerase sigma factor [Oceanirhabdus seepicola]